MITMPTPQAKTFISIFLIIAALTNVAWAVTGDKWCNNYMCVIVAVEDDGTANIQVQGSSSVGWLGFGVGTSMLTGDLTVMWANSDNTYTLSRRKASSYVMPQPISNQTALKLDSTATGLISGKLQIAFTRPQVLSESSVNSEATSFLWAFSSTKPSGTSYDATIQQHDTSGSFKLDLTKSTTGTNSTNTTQSFDSSKVGLSDYDKMVYSHGKLPYA
ncbi:hypothetical protein BC936DRAFT_145665 [Jimgerdemannia flammicorona]|uniref:DOMON domain-containing protein n=1 Tax=Jimgerdemannia flammicorona TaxID=994334 RepID=A0A433D9K5_9FUNG|nr:hypothetical protein BC936DRAFT_145665 [Jimgerdemannia flammicorona]